MTEKTNWWLSWYCPNDKMGKFELHSPWWISGETTGDDEGRFAYTVCAAVQASSEDQAKLLVIMSHDADVMDWASTSIDWRFVDPRPADWSPFNDRFQADDWMQWNPLAEATQ